MDAIPFKHFLKRLESELDLIPHQHQLAFTASCCERAYPNYVSFFREARWGGPAVLRTALNTIWDLIEGSDHTLEDLDELENKCELVTPDLDDFSTPDIDVLAAAAQEAAFMVRLLIQLHRDKQPCHVLSIVTFPIDTIDMYVQVTEQLDPADPQLEERIARHPLMIQEVCKQSGDLLKLTKTQSQTDLQAFRRYATNPERSNIGLLVQH